MEVGLDPGQGEEIGESASSVDDIRKWLRFIRVRKQRLYLFICATLFFVCMDRFRLLWLGRTRHLLNKWVERRSLTRTKCCWPKRTRSEWAEYRGAGPPGISIVFNPLFWIYEAPKPTIFDSQNVHREIFHFVHTPWLESGTPFINWFCVSLNPLYDQQATNKFDYGIIDQFGVSLFQSERSQA